MYRGFNLKIPNELNESRLLTIGKGILKITNECVKESLDSYLLDSGSLDGNKIIENWFPEFKSHIFLSHSHKDEEKAIIIAGMLYDKFNILTFIDSTVWGYSNELLKKIDNKYCLQSNGEIYDYDKRNYSTAHVHLMLSTALNKMMDSSECLFFLNSPNSISTSTEINQRTNSPWIFSEIATSKIIRKQTPQRLKRETRLFSAKDLVIMNESEQIRFSVEYDLELSHLTELNNYDLQRWINTQASSPENALDNLYNQHKINPKFLL
ncbi:hypothetical protein BC952_1290 [Flavobacterium limicola]|uniref:TIR domain-containing protein n=1 Tax=Flavobacterium limicola TaxID=180441 RepID=A0A495S6V7_9FLAO|nr:hypothetical protein [Flavobacterium limicola]RKS95597.1 hypothetical protein BC952_1290 [Flavobacterium limicola]